MREVLAILLLSSGAWCALGQTSTPFETTTAEIPSNSIDEAVLKALDDRGIAPALLCSDEVFVRRVFLDVTGTLPTAAEAKSFLDDEGAGKRAALIDDLLGRDEHAVYWTLKWCDALRVKAEFPINLWPNAVQAYHRWLYEVVRENRPYDEVARALLTSSGSNFRVPPVNFYRAVQGHEPGDLARAAAQTFMGTRLETWPGEAQADMEVFFSRVAYKTTAEWKEEIICLDPTPTEGLAATFPDGVQVQIAPDQDPREVFTDWLVDPANPWFARNAVNRTWSWLLGRGLVHEPDDFRPDNPPVHPEVLDSLAEELVRSDYDLRHVARLILNSRTYQQASIPRSDHPDAGAMFAYYPIRPLGAEVLIDALCRLTGTTETYTSEIPEPFTYIPEAQRSIALADGSISSPFLEMFGRPARDTGLASERSDQPTDAQRLHLLNSSHVQQKIERGPRMQQVLKRAGWKSPAMARALYLHILSRPPTEAELGAAQAYLDNNGKQKKTAFDDLAWALINTKEFLYRH